MYAHDFRSGKPAQSFAGHRAAITSLAFRSNSRQLFSGSHDRTVKVWNMDEMCYVETLYGHHSEVLALDSLNQERALSVGSDRTLRLWKVVDETQLIFRGHEASIDCVSMTNEEIFVSGSQDGAVAVWSVRKKKPIVSRPRAHGMGGCDAANSLDNWISSVAAMRFTDVFASGSCDGVVRMWQARESLLHALWSRDHSLFICSWVPITSECTKYAAWTSRDGSTPCASHTIVAFCSVV